MTYFVERQIPNLGVVSSNLAVHVNFEGKYQKSTYYFHQIILVLNFFNKFMKIFLILFVSLFSSSVFAKEYAAWGIVTNTCEMTIEIHNLAADIGGEVEESTTSEYHSVIQSYLSGINLYIHNEFGKFKHFYNNSIDYAYSYLMNYCEKNPEKKVVEGILEYLISLPFIENE